MRKVFFYTKNLKENFSDTGRFCLPKNQMSGVENWIKRTYYYLNANAAIDFEIELTETIPQEGVILFHKGYFNSDLKPNPKQYFICIQADHGRHRYAQMHIVQNPCQLNSFSTNRKSLIDKLFPFCDNKFISYWSQAGLIERSGERKNKIENVCFYGRAKNFISGLSDQLRKDLMHMDMSLKLDYEAKNWSDYSEADIVLAIRDFSGKPNFHKPYSKITNAILAGALVIAAPESSSYYFKKKYYPNLPIAASYDELVEIIKSIKENPEKYRNDAEACRQQIEEIENLNIQKNWPNLIQDSFRLFRKWKQSSPMLRKIYFGYRAR